MDLSFDAAEHIAFPHDRLSGNSRTNVIDRWIYVFTAASLIAIVFWGFIPDSFAKIAAIDAGRRAPFPPNITRARGPHGQLPFSAAYADGPGGNRQAQLAYAAWHCGNVFWPRPLSYQVSFLPRQCITLPGMQPKVLRQRKNKKLQTRAICCR